MTTISGRYGVLKSVDVDPNAITIFNWRLNYLRNFTRYIATGLGQPSFRQYAYPKGSLAFTVQDIIPPSEFFKYYCHFTGFYGPESGIYGSGSYQINVEQTCLRNIIMRISWNAKGVPSLITDYNFDFINAITTLVDIESAIDDTIYESGDTPSAYLVEIYYYNSLAEEQVITLNNYGIKSLVVEMEIRNDLRVSAKTIASNIPSANGGVLITRVILELEDITGIGYFTGIVEDENHHDYWMRITLNIIDDVYWQFKYIGLIDIRDIVVDVSTGSIVRATFVFEQGNSQYTGLEGHIVYPDLTHSIIYPWINATV